ncbi:hypothetical protein, partial [Enterocloster citroniae]|uniref:hypothetical protein n=1 Tax=Enterocloster citroniae TaxID=358743 RepID=UPI0034A2D6FF
FINKLMSHRRGRHAPSVLQIPTHVHHSLLLSGSFPLPADTGLHGKKPVKYSDNANQAAYSYNNTSTYKRK